jgi:hypothetical protein
MKKSLTKLFVVSFFFASCKSNIPYTEIMKSELRQMYLEDQRLQTYDLKKVERKEYSDSMANEFNLLCKKNTIVIKKYFNDYGYPGIKENGQDASIKFWVIAQHSDHDIDFQKKVLKAMKKELRKKNIDSRNYAYLFDRVMKNENKPQLYGTQMIWDSLGKHSLYRIKCPKKLNIRREKMGLEIVESYVEGFNH